MKHQTAIHILLTVLCCFALGVQAKHSSGKIHDPVYSSHPQVLGENPAAEQLSVPSLKPLAPLQTFAIPEYNVRIIYLIPSNRSPQANAEKILQRHALRVQRMFREELARFGYAAKNLRIETQDDQITPKIDVRYLLDNPQRSWRDSDFHSDYFGLWNNLLEGLAAAGVPPWQPGEVLWVFAEIQEQSSVDGTFAEDSTFFGGASWDALQSGVAIVTGETLARLAADLLTNNTPFAGATLPGMPFPLTEASFPWFEGTTLSSTSSSAQGASAHELAHALGLPHDFRNDANFNGNLMANGLRGFRGWFYPDRYPSDDVRLPKAAAFLFNSSRFFNADGASSDPNPPAVEIIDIPSSGLITPTQGLFPVRFSASGTSPLVGAVLLRNGNAVAEMPLSSTSVTTTITANDYQPVSQLSASTDTWELYVYDNAGNHTVASINAAPAAGFSRAVIPYVQVSKRKPVVGTQTVLDANQSVDPDGSASQIRVEWDFNGDGLYDTTASRTKSYTRTYPSAGVYQVVARLTDQVGNKSVSMPIGIRVESPSINGYVSRTLASTSTASSVCPAGFATKLERIATIRNTSTRTLSQLRLEIREQSGVILVKVGGIWVEEGEFFDLPKTQGYSDSRLTNNEVVQIPITACLENAQFSSSTMIVHGLVQ